MHVHDDARHETRQDVEQQEGDVASELQHVRRVDEQDVAGLKRREELHWQRLHEVLVERER